MPERKWLQVGYSYLTEICYFSFKFTVKLAVSCLFSLNSKFLSIAPSSMRWKTLLATSFLQKVLIELLSMLGLIFYTICVGSGSMLCLNMLIWP
jgi:hypothetical protein